MQITLIQSEIEQALTDYIHSQINVKEGQKITIELKATRGAEGTTAVIDIVAEKPAAKAEPVVKPQVLTNTPTKPAAKAEPKPEVKPDPKPEVVEDNAGAAAADTAAEANAEGQANESQATPADNAGESGEAGVADAGDAGEAQGTADPVVETPAADATAKPKSLFEGLRKPKNE